MSYDLYLANAVELHNQGNFSEAEKLYRQCLAINPNNPDVLNLLGLIAQAKGLDGQAIELFYQAIAKSPLFPPYHFNLALSLENLGKYVEAIEAYTKASGIKETHNNLGNIYKKIGNLEKAREEYQKAINIDVNFADAAANLAFSYLKDGLAFEKLSVLENNFLAEYYLSLICFENNQLNEAQNHGQKANYLAPCVDYINCLLGQIFYAFENFNEAKKYFLKTLALNEFNLQALLFLANIQTSQNQFLEAEENYKKILDIEPQFLDAHINYANLLHLQKRLPEALEEYRQAIIINPKIAEVSNNLGVIIKEQENYEEALGLFFNALVLKPELEEISINIVETLQIYAKSNFEEAVKIAENWFKTYPANIFAKHLLSSLQGEVGADDLKYNQKLFDNFAANYEDVLQKIQYSLPAKIKDIFGQIEGCILDLGCGTGLLAEELKNDKNTIIGVDLSEEMLKLANSKNLYIDLVQDDCLNYLQKHSDFDYIFALDVFCYIANLGPILNLLKDRRVAFSIESDGSVEDFKIQPSGRYKHNPAYIEKLLPSLKREDLVLRYEDDQEVQGCLFYML